MIPLFKVLMAPDAPKAAAEVLSSGYIGQGEKVEEFERKLKAVLHSPVDILTVNSCTSAIDLALRLIGIKPGDYVVTTAQTCTATNSPIVTQGAIPVWVDVDPITGLMSPESVFDAMVLCPRKPKAIMAVDWAGRVCDYEALKGFNVPVIEDAAHAFLACDDEEQHIAKDAGDYVAWSFQAIKALTTVDGGALKCPPGDVERARLLRWYGLDRRSGKSFRCAQNIQSVGFKYHMHDVAASIGIANLPEACIGVYKSRANALFYNTVLKNLPGVGLAPFDPGCSYWLYTILVEDREGFVRFMTERGIETSQVHARNDHHDAFKSASISPVPLPGLDSFSSRQISIPVGWWLTQKERDLVAHSVTEWSKTL